MEGGSENSFYSLTLKLKYWVSVALSKRLLPEPKKRNTKCFVYNSTSAGAYNVSPEPDSSGDMQSKK